MEQLSIDIGAKVQWSDWSCCESSFSMLLVPHRPGVFAVAEEVVESHGGRRMLALFHIAEARDLSLAVSHLFATGNPVRERLSDARCFVRYTMISDPENRRAVYDALRAWMAVNAQQASGISDGAAATAQPAAELADCDPADCTRETSDAIKRASALKSEATHGIERLAPPNLPAGF